MFVCSTLKNSVTNFVDWKPQPWRVNFHPDKQHISDSPVYDCGLFTVLFAQTPIKNRDASVSVREDWEVVEEMDFPRLTKLSLPNVGEPEEL